jgi:hypothetical protein
MHRQHTEKKGFMKHLLLVAAVLGGFFSTASAGPDIPLQAKVVKVSSEKGSFSLADMKCAPVADDPDKLKCDVSLLSVFWADPPEVYDERAAEADRTKSIDEGIAEIQSNPQSFCKKLRDAVDDMNEPTGQRKAKFMDVETRGFFDKYLKVCETSDPGSLTARLISLMPRAKIDAFIISTERARIQSDNELCRYLMRSKTHTFSKRSENQWEYKKRISRENGCDSQHQSELVFDPGNKEWTWRTKQELAPDVDPEKKCRVFQFHETYKSADTIPAPGCKYISLE